MGTGIGLSICKKIAELHEDYINASGVEGEAATFSIYFPVRNKSPTYYVACNKYPCHLIPGTS